MAITNTDKPVFPNSQLSIGGGYVLSIGSLWQLAIGPLSALMTNTSKVSSSLSNSSVSSARLWEGRSLPWQLSTPWQTTNGMTNISKPI